MICQYEDIIYLIPISTIVAGRSGSSDDLDDDESSPIDVEEDEDQIEKDLHVKTNNQYNQKKGL